MVCLDYSVPMDRSIKDSRANHLSYELSAKLASNSESAVFNRIQLHEQNSKKTSIIAADQWLMYTRDWFLSLPYNPEANVPEQFIFDEVNNFLLALIETCNHKEWPDGKQRWLTAIGQKKTLIQESSHFQMILELYPLIHSLCWESYSSEIEEEEGELIQCNIFTRVLSPLRWVDWASQDLRIFKGGGEKGRRTFQIWVEEALKNGISYTHEEVMSKEFHSEPGRGILAHPADSEIELGSINQWPKKKVPVLISSQRPANTMRVCTWQIFDEKERDLTEMLAKTNTQSNNNIAWLSIAHNEALMEVERLDVRVSWRNAVEPAGKGSIRLERT